MFGNNLYTEEQMSMAMGVTKDRLVWLIEKTNWGFVYHTPRWKSDTGEYLFNKQAYTQNLAVQGCMNSGSHDYKEVSTVKGAIIKCARCNTKHHEQR